MCSDIEPHEQTKGAANDLERERLQLSAGETVLRTRRLRRHRGHPVMLEEACLALARFPVMGNDGLADYRIVALAKKCGVHLARASERVSLVEATPEIAQLLGVEPGKPLLRLDRVVFSMAGQPVEWRVAVCNLKEKFYLADMS